VAKGNTAEQARTAKMGAWARQATKEAVLDLQTKTEGVAPQAKTRRRGQGGSEQKQGGPKEQTRKNAA